MKRNLIALILIILLSFPNVMTAAETEQINLQKTEEERNAEFNQALSKISSDLGLTDFDKLAFQDGLKRSKNNFIRLYHSQWKALGMGEKLETAINTAFDENTKDLAWGTTGLQMVLFDDIINKIQDSVAFKFADSFDDFLRDLEIKWGETLQRDVADFYRRTSVSVLASDRNPMIQAYIRNSSAAQDKGSDVMERVKASMQKQYPELSVSGTKIAGGVLAVILRRQIQKIIAQQLGKTALRKVASAGVSKVAGMAIPVAGWVMAAWGVADVAATVWKVPDDVKNMLRESNQSLYYDAVPEIYWDAMSPYVMDTFVDEFGKLQRIKNETAFIANNPRVNELSNSLNNEEATQFYERILALSHTLGRKDYEDLLLDFGELIRDCSRSDFETLASMLQHGRKIQVKEWLNLAGDKYFELYSSFSPETWTNFPPNEESLEILSWCMKLPPRSRNIAVKLDISDIKWIKDELPERFLSNLFLFKISNSIDTEPDEIHAEIKRLSKISDKESRRPWLSKFSYFWILYGFYVKSIILLIILLVVIRLVFIIKDRSKKEKKQPTQNQTPVVNINIPSYPEQINRKKYKVKAKISASLVNELKTITWDISQQILPAGDGSKDRILSVELESLDDITRWFVENKNCVEVLQPEELKIMLGR